MEDVRTIQMELESTLDGNDVVLIVDVGERVDILSVKIEGRIFDSDSFSESVVANWEEEILESVN